MAEVILRFFGRFVFAEPFVGDTTQGMVNALAVNMTYNPDLRSAVHRTVMTAPRRRVVPDGCRPPDLVAMSSEKVALESEHVLWQLADTVVDVAGTTPFVWNDKSVLADLNALSGGTLAEASLYGSGDGEPGVNVVQLRTGRGVAVQLEKGVEYVFAPLSEAQPDTRAKSGKPLADMVEVTIPLSERETLFLFRLTPRSGGPTSSIAVTTEEGFPTIVTFSNLCGHGHGPVDREFAGLYEVLETPPLMRDRLVPIALPSLGKITDCYTPAYSGYRVG